MPRSSGVYSPPAGTTATPNTPLSSPAYNAYVADITADLNAARPISAGGTGATSAGAALIALGGGTSGIDVFEASTIAAIRTLIGVGPVVKVEDQAGATAYAKLMAAIAACEYGGVIIGEEGAVIDRASGAAIEFKSGQTFIGNGCRFAPSVAQAYVVQVEDDADNVTLVDLDIDAGGTTSVASYNTAAVIYASGPRNLRIIRPRIKNYSFYGIDIKSSATRGFDGVWLVNAYVHTPAAYVTHPVFFWSGTGGYRAKNAFIDGGYFHGSNPYTPTIADYTASNQYTADFIVWHGVIGGHIRNCTILYSGSAGISLTRGTENVVVSNVLTEVCYEPGFNIGSGFELVHVSDVSGVTHFAISSGTKTLSGASGATATLTLDPTPATYPVQNQFIYIIGSSGGTNDGIYEVTGVPVVGATWAATITKASGSPANETLPAAAVVYPGIKSTAGAVTSGYLSTIVEDGTGNGGWCWVEGPVGGIFESGDDVDFGHATSTVAAAGAGERDAGYAVIYSGYNIVVDNCRSVDTVIQGGASAYNIIRSRGETVVHSCTYDQPRGDGAATDFLTNSHGNVGLGGNNRWKGRPVNDALITTSGAYAWQYLQTDRAGVFAKAVVASTGTLTNGQFLTTTKTSTGLYAHAFTEAVEDANYTVNVQLETSGYESMVSGQTTSGYNVTIRAMTERGGGTLTDLSHRVTVSR